MADTAETYQMRGDYAVVISLFCTQYRSTSCNSAASLSRLLIANCNRIFGVIGRRTFAKPFMVLWVNSIEIHICGCDDNSTIILFFIFFYLHGKIKSVFFSARRVAESPWWTTSICLFLHGIIGSNFLRRILLYGISRKWGFVSIRKW
jgi:4-amino-4-deoxy-L-arabinose transferase-like glycosyltransferase